MHGMKKLIPTVTMFYNVMFFKLSMSPAALQEYNAPSVDCFS